MTSTNLKPVSERELWVPRLRWGVRLSRLELIPHSLRAERLAVERVGLGRPRHWFCTFRLLILSRTNLASRHRELSSLV